MNLTIEEYKPHHYNEVITELISHLKKEYVLTNDIFNINTKFFRKSTFLYSRFFSSQEDYRKLFNFFELPYKSLPFHSEDSECLRSHIYKFVVELVIRLGAKHSDLMVGNNVLQNFVGAFVVFRENMSKIIIYRNSDTGEIHDIRCSTENRSLFDKKYIKEEMAIIRERRISYSAKETMSMIVAFMKSGEYTYKILNDNAFIENFFFKYRTSLQTYKTTHSMLIQMRDTIKSGTWARKSKETETIVKTNGITARVVAKAYSEYLQKYYHNPYYAERFSFREAMEHKRMVPLNFNMSLIQAGTFSNSQLPLRELSTNHWKYMSCDISQKENSDNINPYGLYYESIEELIQNYTKFLKFREANKTGTIFKGYSVELNSKRYAHKTKQLLKSKEKHISHIINSLEKDLGADKVRKKPQQIIELIDDYKKMGVSEKIIRSFVQRHISLESFVSYYIFYPIVEAYQYSKFNEAFKDLDSSESKIAINEMIEEVLEEKRTNVGAVSYVKDSFLKNIETDELLKVEEIVEVESGKVYRIVNKNSSKNYFYLECKQLQKKVIYSNPEAIHNSHYAFNITRIIANVFVVRAKLYSELMKFIDDEANLELSHNKPSSDYKKIYIDRVSSFLTNLLKAFTSFNLDTNGADKIHRYAQLIVNDLTDEEKIYLINSNPKSIRELDKRLGDIVLEKNRAEIELNEEKLNIGKEHQVYKIALGSASGVSELLSLTKNICKRNNIRDKYQEDNSSVKEITKSIQLPRDKINLSILKHNNPISLLGTLAKGVCITGGSEARISQVKKEYMNLCVYTDEKLLLWGLLVECEEAERREKGFGIDTGSLKRLYLIDGEVYEKENEQPRQILEDFIEADDYDLCYEREIDLINHLINTNDAQTYKNEAGDERYVIDDSKRSIIIYDEEGQLLCKEDQNNICSNEAVEKEREEKSYPAIIDNNIREEKRGKKYFVLNSLQGSLDSAALKNVKEDIAQAIKELLQEFCVENEIEGILFKHFGFNAVAITGDIHYGIKEIGDLNLRITDRDLKRVDFKYKTESDTDGKNCHYVKDEFWAIHKDRSNQA